MARWHRGFAGGVIAAGTTTVIGGISGATDGDAGPGDHGLRSSRAQKRWS